MYHICLAAVLSRAISSLPDFLRAALTASNKYRPGPDIRAHTACMPSRVLPCAGVAGSLAARCLVVLTLQAELNRSFPLGRRGAHLLDSLRLAFAALHRWRRWFPADSNTSCAPRKQTPASDIQPGLTSGDGPGATEGQLNFLPGASWPCSRASSGGYWRHNTLLL